MTPQDHIASAAYYRDRAKVRLSEHREAALRMAAYHDAMALRNEVRDIRRTAKGLGTWTACQTGIYDELDEARIRWREAIWDMNWTLFYVERPSQQEAA